MSPGGFAAPKIWSIVFWEGWRDAGAEDVDDTDCADWRGAAEREAGTVLLEDVLLDAAGGIGLGMTIEPDDESVIKEGSKLLVFITVLRRSALVVAIL
jgi:hypothetical protein